MLYEQDCIVIGAGVVGLSVARELALSGRDVIVLESANAIGTETSSRNSEVIHAGIYYPTGSLKAALCVAGKHSLYAYCESRGVAHRQCGKLIVACDAEDGDRLHAIEKQAQANGIEDLQWKSAQDAKQLEPSIRCSQALLSPSTGIIDSHALMLALQGDAEDAGVSIAFQAPVIGGECRGARIALRIGGEEPTTLMCRTVVNSAGLNAPTVAANLDGFPPVALPRSFMARGNYFTLNGASPFRRLIYPIPEPGGLGIHVTLDLAGQVRFGPDVEWIEKRDYRVNENRVASFYPAIRRYWPELPDGALTPGYAGIRPKIAGPGEAAADFVIQGPEEHGIDGLINLFGIESPGLTSCLAIAKRICRILMTCA